MPSRISFDFDSDGTFDFSLSIDGSGKDTASVSVRHDGSPESARFLEGLIRDLSLVSDVVPGEYGNTFTCIPDAVPAAGRTAHPGGILVGMADGSVRFGPGTGPEGVQLVGDWNGDGKDDIAVVGLTGGVPQDWFLA